MKKLLIVVLAALTLSSAAFAQEAPPPRKMPRTPVNREALPDRKPTAPPSRLLEGRATVIDSERLRLGEYDLRLFGIVPPQLSASFGPQARATLDNLVTSQNISCAIRDRDQAGRFLATCHTANNTDLAIELLRRGLAVTARGSLSATELNGPYLAAEQAAQAEKAGLWSVITPAAAPVPETLKPVAVIPLPPPPMPVHEVKKEEKTAKATDKDAVLPIKLEGTPVLAASKLAPASVEEESLEIPDLSGGFLRRYQLLITGFIMLVTALSILIVISMQRRQEKRDEMKAIAAALRGELMAARAVCQARLKTITSDAEDKATTWPRIRATLYQAYVGRLGFLGAELARQVASIYGRSSDYASYYNGAENGHAETAPKKQALQTLIQHIDEVLPKLVTVEQTGRVPGLKAALMPTPIHSITETAQPPAPVQAAPSSASTAASEVTSSRPSAAPLWNAVRKFARERLKEKEKPANEETDYASIIEAEMASLSFSEMGDDSETLPGNVTKIRETGT